MALVLSSVAMSFIIHPVIFPNFNKDTMHKDPCFDVITPTYYPLLPLITGVTPDNILNMGSSCEVCCMKRGYAGIFYRIFDPTSTDDMKFYHDGNEIQFPPTTTLSTSFGKVYHTVFEGGFRPGNYDIRLQNRYGFTRLKFKVLYDSTDSGCTSPLQCQRNRIGRSTAD